MKTNENCNSGPVDVLAVMDRLVREVPMGCGHILAITQARAAVAELVEAAKNADSELTAAYENEADEDVKWAIAGLRAALAKFGGGQ